MFKLIKRRKQWIFGQLIFNFNEAKLKSWKDFWGMVTKPRSIYPQSDGMSVGQSQADTNTVENLGKLGLGAAYLNFLAFGCLCSSPESSKSI